MITLDHICKRFGTVTAVNDISFTIAEGETLVLLGTSGCGKTTTLRMINRLTEPTSGTILINGKNILQQPVDELRRGIGYVLQHHGLFPHYTVAENIAVVPKLLRWSKEKIVQRIEVLMEKLQLPAQYSGVYPQDLSGGQQQRVGVARALAADPPILLMDEPFGALDPVTRSGIRKELMGLDELNKKTIVLVTHDVQEAFEMGDKICLMDKGSIIQTGTPAELLFHPVNKFVLDFFNEQRLQLELDSISLHEVWHSFPLATDHTKQSIPSSKSLWQAMKYINKQNENLVVKNEETGERKEVSFSDIQLALHDKKKHS